MRHFVPLLLWVIALTVTAATTAYFWPLWGSAPGVIFIAGGVAIYFAFRDDGDGAIGMGVLAWALAAAGIIGLLAGHLLRLV